MRFGNELFLGFNVLTLLFVPYSWSGKPSEAEGHSGSEAGETAGAGGEAGARGRHLDKPGAMGGPTQQDRHHPHAVRTRRVHAP